MGFNNTAYPSEFYGPAPARSLSRVAPLTRCRAPTASHPPSPTTSASSRTTPKASATPAAVTACCATAQSSRPPPQHNSSSPPWLLKLRLCTQHTTRNPQNKQQRKQDQLQFE